MISLIEGLPDDVVGIVATGKVTKHDRDRVLVPAIQRSLRRHDKIRLYYEISSRFPGAAWDDLHVAIEPLPQWARIAVVTDVGWIRHTVNALRFLIPGDIRVFATVRAREGWEWIASDLGTGFRVGSRFTDFHGQPYAVGVRSPSMPRARPPT